MRQPNKQTAIRASNRAEIAKQAARKRRRPYVMVIGLAIVGLLLAGGIYYWLSTRNLESTDDAYTDGRAITIAPQVAGVVVSLDVTDNQFVKKDQPLIHIDPRQYIIDREQAEGALATAKAQYAGQQFGAGDRPQEFSRPAGAGPGAARQRQGQSHQEPRRTTIASEPAETGDDTAGHRCRDIRAQTGASAGHAGRSASHAEFAGATAHRRDRCAGRAVEGPGRAGPGEARSGQPQSVMGRRHGARRMAGSPSAMSRWAITSRPGQQIFSIVAPEVWITANFKESQLTDMRKGQPVRIRIDAYPKLDSARVMSTASSSAPDPSSPLFRRKMPPAISSRWCSACRSRSSSTAASIRIFRCRSGSRPSRR